MSFMLGMIFNVHFLVPVLVAGLPIVIGDTVVLGV